MRKTLKSAQIIPIGFFCIYNDRNTFINVTNID
jgi:hypothetical protein